MKNTPLTLIIAVSLHLIYYLSSRVRLFFSFYLLCREKVDVVREVSSSVRVLKKPGDGKNTHSVFEVFFLCQCAIKGRTEQSGRKGG